MDFKSKPQITSRWIQPFPETAPEVKIEMKVLTRKDVVRIYDKHKIAPGKDGALLGQVLGVQEDTVIATVAAWEGLTKDGEPIPCTATNKVKYMIEHELTDENGEATNLWLICSQRLADEIEAEKGN